MPLRGRTRISSTGSEHSGESVIRTSSATMPLTFGNPANKLFAQALFAIHFFGRKTEYAGTPLTLTKSTARRRTDIHENSNSASLYSLQGRYLFSDALPPMVICLTVMVVVTRFEFRMPLFIGLSLFTFDLYQWHIVLLRVLAP